MWAMAQAAAAGWRSGCRDKSDSASPPCGEVPPLRLTARAIANIRYSGDADAYRFGWVRYQHAAGAFTPVCVKVMVAQAVSSACVPVAVARTV